MMYSELHLHTAYSFLDGASQIEELLNRACELDYRALAITDHDNLAGAMTFAQYARLVELQPITGAELTLDVAGRRCHLTLLAETPEGYANLCRLLTDACDPQRSGQWPVVSGQWSFTDPTTTHYPLPTDHSPCPCLSAAALEGRTAGLIGLSGCRQGLLCQLIDEGRLREAEAAGRWLRDLFGGHALYLELQRHLVKGDERRVQRLVELSERLAVGIVATGNVHYHERARHRLQDAMVAIKHRSTLENSHRLRRPNSEFFLRDPAEMAARFSDLPQAIHATGEIAERCREFDLTEDLGYRFPEFRRDVRAGGDGTYGTQGTEENPSGRPPLPQGEGWGEGTRASATQEPSPQPSPRGRGSLSGEGGSPSEEFQGSSIGALLNTAVDADVVLNEFCREALDWRYPEGSPDRAEAMNRLREELRLIQHHGLAGFFLVYRDLLQMAREVANEVRGAGTARGASGLPPGRGRGSSVSSIVCYLIGLSHVDPVTNNLFLGRFLNEEMHSVPDIDLDFARDIREQLILRVYEHYGKDHAALVCSFATYHIRSAVRDLGKVLGLPAPMLDKLAKLSEWGSAATVEQEMERLPEFKDLVHVPIWRHLIELAGQIASFPRHMSQHVGGMIISSRPIIELVPVQPAAMEGRYICQWDKDSCDDARFIKVDFLALGMLSLVEECLELIWQHHGKVEDLSRIDHNDPEIYDQICAGDTVGLFQIESRAQIQMLPRTQPRNLDDLAIEVAIVRPGPIVGGAVNPYVRQRERQRKGATDYEVDHPYLKEVLRDTLGVVLFQDQVMQVAKELAGFTDGQADGLRRAMSRRRSAEAMQGFREEFLNGAAMRGVDEATATKVFDKLVGFSEFGFPKSHAAAFAVLAFQSAWLRFHYPAEYLCALFNNQPMGFYAPHVLVGDGRRHGVQVLPVDINRSGVKCTVEYQVMSDESWVMSDSDGSAHDSSLITHHSSLAAVRLGLDRVRSLNEEVSAAIVAERERHGPFRDLEDFIGRIAECGLKRPAMENLILLGAFPSFELNRRELLWQYGLLEQTRREKRPSRNLPLGFGTEQDMIERPEMSAWERMVTDYHTLGLSPSLHPLGLMRARLPVDIVSAEGLESLPDGVNVRVAGLVVCRQRPGTAQGFTFLLIEDETGMANAIIRPPLYERKRPIVRGETMVIVRGKLQSRDGNINILVDDIEPLREPTLPTLESRERAGNDPREEAAREPVPAIPPARSFR